MRHRYPRSHTFRGRKFKLRWRPPPKTKAERQKKRKPAAACLLPEQQVLYIDPKVGPRDDPLDFFDSVLHESTHACFPDLDDDAVQEYTDDFFKLMKRMKAKVTFGDG